MTESQPIWVKALLDNELTHADHRVFSYLLWRQGKNGSAWPSQETIAADLNLTDRSVRRSTKKLEEKGYIYVTRKESQGRGQCLAYSIPKGGQKSPPLGDKGGQESPPLGGKRRTKTTPKGGQESPPNTIQEHLQREGGRTQRFQKPTVDEVREYAKSIHYDLDAKYFVDYYEARGWMLKNTKMRDWRATIRNWRQRDEKEAGQSKSTPKPLERGPDGLTAIEQYRKKVGETKC
ncbi:MAG: hypothetical protein CEE38_08420 [Planctomycetes bacterium B3_Pla]|nr:MAG: hypothetical protein CEE38_08420 [Planctomycetes bacterium B3_Pla]